MHLEAPAVMAWTRVGSGGPRAGDREIERHGKASIRESTHNGAVIGLYITCCRHGHDDDATPNLPCQKHLAFGIGGTRGSPLTRDECMRRLKRWFIVGGSLMENAWPAGQRRACHIKYGGARLREFASDGGHAFARLSDAELDQACCIRDADA